MNDDLHRSLTALMEHAAAPAEPARVDDTRRRSLEGLARARRRAHRRRITSLVGTGVLVAGVAAFLVMALPKGDRSEPSGTTTSTTQRLPKPTRTEAPNRPGRWWLYPDRSRVGLAASAAVGAPAKWVEARRVLANGALTGADRVSLRDERKNGWELDWYYAFARWELSYPSTPTEGGEYWGLPASGTPQGTIRSVYFLSGDGIGVWAAHFSPSPDVEPVSDDAPLAMAKRFVAELRKRGDFRTAVLAQPSDAPGGDFRNYKMVRASVIGVLGLPRVSKIRINRGRRDGVSVGAPVLAGDPPEAMVGVISRVAASDADVSLLRSGQTNVGVKILGSAGVRGALLATRSGELRVTGIPAEKPVAVNQLVVTAGFPVKGRASLIPPGIPVGFVRRVADEPGGQRVAWVTPSTDAVGAETLTVLGPR